MTDTTLTIVQIDADIFAVRLGDETLCHFFNRPAAVEFVQKLADDTALLIDSVNERIGLLAISENHLASVTVEKQDRLWRAVEKEISIRLDPRHHRLVNFSFAGLHWMTIVTCDGDDETGETWQTCNDPFYMTTNCMTGERVDAVDLLEGMHESFFEQLEKMAIEEALS